MLTAVEGCPQLPGPKAPIGGGDLQRAFHKMPVHLLRPQALAQCHQSPFAEGRCVAVQTVQHQVPTAIYGGGFDHFVIGDLRIGLEQGRQRQLGRRDRRMALRLVLIECQQFLLQGLSKQHMAVLSQGNKQLGSADVLDNGVFRRGQVDWGRPQRWTHEEPSFWNRKKLVVSQAITSWKNTRPMF